MWRLVIVCLLLAAADTSDAAKVPPDIARCFHEAGARFSVDWRLLQAIAEVESGLNSGAIGLNKKNGRVLSEDIGMMQINSSWLPVLRPMGITRDVLLSNVCQNIHVGAWILAKNIAQNGVNWMSVGAYNAGFKNANEPFRLRYARKVYARYIELTGY
ncbi:Transglycosylase SLT domain-containing protein [Kosakonia radicincitans]|uniref:Transglycosylase SLT domain-containing protein n=1 Tax=Kosakonia radicincitans TaxID=283686 RepID=A0AAX2EZA0_9ENTR|nr:lytic transglycosylase domain-containing protein [Kosakonia radicincitans]SFF37893.1 Transglycosylase SLT domain-containing protein [Kosakonia radicincitans]SFR26208.1 Transglycosylase SLT domain-containing protein [Kosakonia radicincitans]SFU16701.1 Transglycosylase SLT domain-containing protein [Kosakonia radicincitans]SFY31918.1 Transglycosylase SLT domain-containing protein [Kosakonia radicincitans]